MPELTDPLNISVELAGVDSSIPLLPEGDHLFQIVESVVEANNEKSGMNWNLKLALVNPTTAVDGREIKPNFPVFMSVALQAKADSKDPDAFRRNICDAVDAIFNTTKENRPNFNAQLVQEAMGKTVLANTYINEWPEGSGNKSSKVRRLKKQQVA